MPAQSRGARESWAEHVRATVVLALPLIGLQLAQMTMGVTDTVMLGWLGPRELAGGHPRHARRSFSSTSSASASPRR